MYEKEFKYLVDKVDGSLKIENGKVQVVNEIILRKNIDKLVNESILGSGLTQMLARYVIRAAALELGVIPASIHGLYIARGAGKVPNDFTVPAINLRALSFNAAQAVFRAAIEINAGAFIFEIARSEIGYTDQRPSEFISNMLAAAIAEGYRGPVFVQGDHFQVSAGKYKIEPEKELQAIKTLTNEAIEAGFYNIDIDTSTLVDLSFDTVEEQQHLNSSLSAEFSEFIRQIEPEGITVSIGGEIGEVGKVNSTPQELSTYTSLYNKFLAEKDSSAIGLSKISIQSGTSHGGVVLPDGSIATVSVDFDTILELSKIARDDFGMGGAVQHGASTLPQEAFGKFVESEACEVHLATGFQNIFYDLCPEDLKLEIYAYLDQNHNNERKADMTDDQFYYKSRKRAIGPFKQKIMALPQAEKDKITSAWEKQFKQLFSALEIKNTREHVEQYVPLVKIMPDLDMYIKMAKETVEQEDVSDLAD